MRTLLLATAAALSFGAASAAYADGGDTPATTRFTIIADQLAHRAQQQPVQRSLAANQPTAMQSYPVHSQTLGTWLFAPAQGNGN
jgi:hypothetical protein